MNSTLANEKTNLEFGCRVVMPIFNTEKQRIYFIDLQREQEMKMGINFEWDSLERNEVVVKEGLQLQKGDEIELEVQLDRNVSLKLKVVGVMENNKNGKFGKDETVDYILDINSYEDFNLVESCEYLVYNFDDRYNIYSN